ncbi:hypothetical protein HP438_00350 [Sphingomonas zeae]|uniref:Uncharacterized protein n=1 Tax=Sphingomonas zeae TaxID=1646122 RepID=A0A7Y6B2T3_9SPHN|nr:hypothetical protein [Sphingomonas zeae]
MSINWVFGFRWLGGRNGKVWAIVLKKSASGAEIIGGWSALKAADWLRQVAAALSSG